MIHAPVGEGPGPAVEGTGILIAFVPESGLIKKDDRCTQRTTVC